MLPVARLWNRIAWAMLAFLPAISMGGESALPTAQGRAPASVVASPQLNSPVSLAPSWYTDPTALSEPRAQAGRAPLVRNLSLEPQAGPAADVKQVNTSDSFRRRLYWDPSH